MAFWTGWIARIWLGWNDDGWLGRIQCCENALYIPMMDIYLYTFVQTYRKCSTNSKPNVNYGLGWLWFCQYRSSIATNTPLWGGGMR